MGGRADMVVGSDPPRLIGPVSNFAYGSFSPPRVQ